MGQFQSISERIRVAGQIHEFIITFANGERGDTLGLGGSLRLKCHKFYNPVDGDEVQ